MFRHLRFQTVISSIRKYPRLEGERARLFNSAAKSKQGLVAEPLSNEVYDAAAIAMAKQYKVFANRPGKRRKVEAPVFTGSHEDILALEARQLLSRPRLVQDAQNGIDDPNKEVNEESSHFKNVELEIEELSSTGDGLARSSNGEQVYVVPFSVPGDRILANVDTRKEGIQPSMTDFVKVLRPSASREGITPRCKYFSQCSGCQLQMLPYESQLAFKKSVVEKAFRNFSGLSSDQIPYVAETGSSPLQYGYRTKLSPHFDGPPSRRGERRRFTSVPEIGFTRKNWRKVMDIESCPIATEIVEEGLKTERIKVAKNIATYQNGATILIRESTERIPRRKDGDQEEADQSQPRTPFNPLPLHSLDPLPTPEEKSMTWYSSGPRLTLTYPTHVEAKTYTSDNDAFATEQIASYTFTSRAGSFFQNNNSILPSFLTHVRANALGPSSTSNSKIKYLLDAYCGSGLFAITLSPLFISVLGIDIDSHSIASARLNATRNSVSNAGFIAADAGDLFADVPFPGDQSLVVIDPPRKGASEDFLRQLCRFGPARVVYVSCNVHTQARDVGMLVRGFGNGGVEGWRYEIESLKGFDFFPQTGHVEGLCILNRVKRDGGEENVGEEVKVSSGEEREDVRRGPSPRKIEVEAEPQNKRKKEEIDRKRRSRLRSKDATDELEALSRAGLESGKA